MNIKFLQVVLFLQFLTLQVIAQNTIVTDSKKIGELSSLISDEFEKTPMDFIKTEEATAYVQEIVEYRTKSNSEAIESIKKCLENDFKDQYKVVSENSNELNFTIDRQVTTFYQAKGFGYFENENQVLFCTIQLKDKRARITLTDIEFGKTPLSPLIVYKRLYEKAAETTDVGLRQIFAYKNLSNSLKSFVERLEKQLNKVDVTKSDW